MDIVETVVGMDSQIGRFEIYDRRVFNAGVCVSGVIESGFRILRSFVLVHFELPEFRDVEEDAEEHSGHHVIGHSPPWITCHCGHVVFNRSGNGEIPGINGVISVSDGLS